MKRPEYKMQFTYMQTLDYAKACNDYIDGLEQQLATAQQEIEELKGITAGFSNDLHQRYGLRWNGPDQPLCVPMSDGYWTPWHIAEARLGVAKQEATAYRISLENLEAKQKMVRAVAVLSVLSIKKAKNGDTYADLVRRHAKKILEAGE